MWDTKSRFTAQTSAWCGMATVSETLPRFLPRVSTRQNDPGLRRWQSLSFLDPERATLSFPSSLGTELRSARGEGKFGQSKMLQWLQDAHERLDTQLEHRRTRDAQLSNNKSSAQLLDMKHGLNSLSEAMSPLQQEADATNLSQLERSKFQDKVLNLEKDLMQMRSSLDTGSNDQPPERTPGPYSRTLLVSQDHSYIHYSNKHKQKADTELCKMREAEAKTKKQESGQNHTTQQLPSSAETQEVLLNRITELNQMLSNSVQNHSEIQEQLTEANNKISQACLEKAILSTQVLKLEDDTRELKAKLTQALSDKPDLIQEREDLRRAQVLERPRTASEGSELLGNIDYHNNKQGREAVLTKEESKVLREVNEKLAHDVEQSKQQLDTVRRQLQELTADRVGRPRQITDLEAENSRLSREKEELLSKVNEEVKDMCCQLRESLWDLQSEKQNVQDRCLRLEAELLEKEEKLRQQEEEYREKDAARVQSIEELKAVASHWTEKWQNVALTLQATHDELEELKKSKLHKEAEKQCDSLLRVELDACKQELELERSRSHTLLHRSKGQGREAVQTQDKQTETDLSESSLSWEAPSDQHSGQNKHARLMQMDSKEIRDSEGQANVFTTDSLNEHLEESSRRMKQEKMLAVQRLQTLQQLNPINDDKQSVEGRKEKALCAVNVAADQQRRMITEQLKNLFKEREEKNAGKANDTASVAQTEEFSQPDWTPKVVRTPVDRWNWQQSPALMPLYEEDEEGSGWQGEEDQPTEEARAQESLRHQMRAGKEANSNLKAEEEYPPRDSGFKQTIKDPKTTEEIVSEPNLGSDEFDLQQKTCFLCPDGIFMAERVDICSPDEDEDEEEGEDK